MGKYYLTTPLYYVNASPHIGHAYTNIITDCVARFHRLKGDSVFFLTGTDEHGEKIKKAAQQENIGVEEFVDKVVVNFKSLWESLNITYDYFIRTTYDFHIKVVQEIIKKLYEKGDIYKAKYEGFYCMPCESFWTSTQIKESAGRCPLCQRELERIIEENYFFRLSRYQDWLKKYLKDNPDFIKPTVRYNEVVGFLENNPLEDLCISRPKKRVSWGIDFPLDNDFVVYVWFDALINYISGVGYLYDEDKFNTWWPADCHFIGKDILRHHAIFWPVMLKALQLDMPRVIFAHGWWKIGEEKMSKSRGNIINPFELTSQIGVDTLRYFLLREVPLGSDGNFSWSIIINRINSDLANDLGNLIYRTLNMVEKYFGGKIFCENKDIPSEFISYLEDLAENYISSMEEFAFIPALEKVWRLINTMNKYIENKKPWIMWQNKKEKDLKYFLFTLLEGIRIVSIYIYPFMPQTALSIAEQLGIASQEFLKCRFSDTNWQKRDFSIRKGKPLFPRIDVD